MHNKLCRACRAVRAYIGAVKNCDDFCRRLEYRYLFILKAICAKIVIIIAAFEGVLKAVDGRSRFRFVNRIVTCLLDKCFLYGFFFRELQCRIPLLMVKICELRIKHL